MRQSFEPDGVTTRNSQPPSESLNCLSAGLALRVPTRYPEQPPQFRWLQTHVDARRRITSDNRIMIFDFSDAYGQSRTTAQRKVVVSGRESYCYTKSLIILIQKIKYDIEIPAMLPALVCAGADPPLVCHPAAIRAFFDLDPVPFFGPPDGGLSRLLHGGWLAAPPEFCNEIGGLLPIALHQGRAMRTIGFRTISCPVPEGTADPSGWL